MLWDMNVQTSLGYMDPDEINVNDWQGREDEGILFIEKAGEILYLPKGDF